MADLTITAANVLVTSNTTTQRVQAGEAVTAGQVVYQKTSDSKYYKTDVTTGSEESKAAGVAVTPAGAADDYFLIATAGDIETGGTMTVNEVYVVSASGAVSPASDLTSGDYGTIVYIAKSAAIGTLVLTATEAARP